MASKVKKIKAKTHKATAKRFRISRGGKGSKLIHLGQREGGGHANSYKNRRQKKSAQSPRALESRREIRKIRRLLGK